MKFISIINFIMIGFRKENHVVMEAYMENKSSNTVPKGEIVTLIFARASEDGLTSRYNVWYNDEIIGYTIF